MGGGCMRGTRTCFSYSVCAALGKKREERERRLV
jgi:hypothetical protein